MVQITLSGGVYNGKAIKVSEEMFNIGCLEIFAPLPEDFAPLPEDIDLMAGCHELELLVYKRLPLTPYVWRII